MLQAMLPITIVACHRSVAQPGYRTAKRPSKHVVSAGYLRRSNSRFVLVFSFPAWAVHSEMYPRPRYPAPSTATDGDAALRSSPRSEWRTSPCRQIPTASRRPRQNSEGPHASKRLAFFDPFTQRNGGANWLPPHPKPGKPSTQPLLS